jgi:hypothetical protein
VDFISASSINRVCVTLYNNTSAIPLASFHRVIIVIIRYQRKDAGYRAALFPMRCRLFLIAMIE